MFPAFSFIGEESVAAGEKTVFTEQPTWVIDPIDGTTNFVHRYALNFSMIPVVCSLGESLFKASFFEEAVYEMCGGVKCIVQIFSKLWSKGPNGIVWTWDVMCLLTVVFLSVKAIQK